MMISEINKSINEYLLEESELSRIKLLMSRRISYLIGKKGLSRKELSEKTGLTEATISYILNGKKFPSFRTIIKLEKCLEGSIINISR